MMAMVDAENLQTPIKSSSTSSKFETSRHLSLVLRETHKPLIAHLYDFHELEYFFMIHLLRTTIPTNLVSIHDLSTRTSQDIKDYASSISLGRQYIRLEFQPRYRILPQLDLRPSLRFWGSLCFLFL
jgi:hypothetical protein